MIEYPIEYILDELYRYKHQCKRFEAKIAELTIERDNFPEIVRCRDCKWEIDGGRYCAKFASDSWDWRNVEPDCYCAWGRKEVI